ncbi:hypothetical protein RhiLY_09509 [Ceratobasidium sp. AG-Ba]|nr:hypothetical protein RhiLY_09509 [Ceratobasidium sp. AG-Ba]
MHSFTRLASFLLFVLSLSFVACAAPTPRISELAVREYGYGNDSDYYSPADNMQKILVDVTADVHANLELMLAATTIAQVESQVDEIVVHIEHASDLVLALGQLDLQAGVQADIAMQVYALVKIIVRACATVSLKFGITAVLALWAKIDECVHLLLVNLAVCVNGILALVLKLSVDVNVKLSIQTYLKLCATALLGSA